MTLASRHKLNPGLSGRGETSTPSRTWFSSRSQKSYSMVSQAVGHASVNGGEAAATRMSLASRPQSNAGLSGRGETSPPSRTWFSSRSQKSYSMVSQAVGHASVNGGVAAVTPSTWKRLVGKVTTHSEWAFRSGSTLYSLNSLSYISTASTASKPVAQTSLWRTPLSNTNVSSAPWLRLGKSEPGSVWLMTPSSQKPSMASAL